MFYQRLFVIILLLSLLVPNAAFAQDDDAPPIGDLALGTEDLSILAGALQEAGLIETLNGEGPFTVFAPVNAAFESVPVGALVPGADADRLVNLLTYHVVEGLVSAEDVAEVQSIPTLQGAPLSVQITEEGVRLNGNVVILSGDIPASNGVVHLIDTVLVPGRPGTVAGPDSLLDVIDNEPDFAFLSTALEIATGARALLDEPSTALTLFAPSQATFNDLPDDTRRALVGDEALLTSTLLYHTLPEIYTSEALLDLLAEDSPQTFETALPGASITLSLSEQGGLLINEVPVLEADRGAGGALHVIGGVLTPPEDALLDADALAALRPVEQADAPSRDEGPVLDENWDAVAGGFSMDELDTADDFFVTVIDPFAADPDEAELYGVEIINWTATYQYTGFIVENFLTAEVLLWMNDQDPTTFQQISQATLDTMPAEERALLPDDLPRE